MIIGRETTMSTTVIMTATMVEGTITIAMTGVGMTMIGMIGDGIATTIVGAGTITTVIDAGTIAGTGITGGTSTATRLPAIRSMATAIPFIRAIPTEATVTQRTRTAAMAILAGATVTLAVAMATRMEVAGIPSTAQAAGADMAKTTIRRTTLAIRMEPWLHVKTWLRESRITPILAENTRMKITDTTVAGAIRATTDRYTPMAIAPDTCPLLADATSLY